MPKPPNANFEERRSNDRRHKPTNPFSLRSFSGRRQTVRRAADCRRYPYTDRYGRKVFLAALLLLLLCVADGLYTLLHTSMGATELNPLMDTLLQVGPYFFFGVKFFLSACAIILLVIYRYNPLARLAWGALVLFYGILFAYHLHFFLS